VTLVIYEKNTEKQHQHKKNFKKTPPKKHHYTIKTNKTPIKTIKTPLKHH
jgi:hypothetical protein